MDKQTFLGIDITPRKELWARVDELGAKVADLRDALNKKDKFLKDLTDSLVKQRDENTYLKGIIAELQDKIKELNKYDIRKRQRNAHGRFAKKQDAGK